MEIYVVQQGDTLQSIAEKFGITSEKIVKDNEIEASHKLVIGQTLVITYPTQVYIVKEGDTVAGIADAFHITILQLLGNNPGLSNREYIYPGETLVISYNNDQGTLLIAGYTYPFIRDDLLNKTLPYLTYLLMFNYSISDIGSLIGAAEESEVIQTAKMYKTASTMVVTAFSTIGEVNIKVANRLLIDKQLQDKVIENMIFILKSKGYYGANLAFQFVNSANQQLYLDYLSNVSTKLHQEGYSVFITLNPGLSYNGKEVTFEKLNYTEFSRISDGILFLTYEWGTLQRSPVQFSIETTTSFLDYIVTQIPLDKIRIGLQTLGYDWTLPYIEGKSKANAINYNSVLELARQMNAIIKYDESSLSAYFEYVDSINNPHIVWFKDARSIDSSIKILQRYGIKGLGFWNIMFYFAQLWLVINTQYEIEKL